MKKIIPTLIISLALFQISCSEDDVKPDPMVAEWYFESFTVPMSYRLTVTKSGSQYVSSSALVGYYKIGISSENTAELKGVSEGGFTNFDIIGANYSIKMINGHFVNNGNSLAIDRIELTIDGQAEVFTGQVIKKLTNRN